MNSKNLDYDLNPFRIAQHQLSRAANVLGLEEVSHEFLRWPQREFHVRIPCKMDDGSTQIFEGFRVQYNDARGPTKGGLRFHPDLTGRESLDFHGRLYNMDKAKRAAKIDELLALVRQTAAQYLLEVVIEWTDAFYANENGSAYR